MIIHEMTSEECHEFLRQKWSINMWWQPTDVATELRGSRDALTPVFYRIRINQVTGHRGTPDSFKEAGSKAAASTSPKAKWSLLSRWF